MPSDISVKVVMPGIHRWPDAPEHRAYLRNDHHHFFSISAIIAVDHPDREVEFHDLQGAVLSILNDTYQWSDYRGLLLDYRDHSCEQIAESVGRVLERDGHTVVMVTVFEDEYVGAGWSPEEKHIGTDPLVTFEGKPLRIER